MPSGGDLQGPQEESSGAWGASKRPSGLWVLSPGRKYHPVQTSLDDRFQCKPLMRVFPGHCAISAQERLQIALGRCAPSPPRDFPPRESHQSARGALPERAGSPRTPVCPKDEANRPHWRVPRHGHVGKNPHRWSHPPPLCGPTFSLRKKAYKIEKYPFAARSAGGPGECAIMGQLPRPPFSLVPSTARSLFGGTKRECGVETVGSYGQAALSDRQYDTVGRRCAISAQEPPAAVGLETRLRAQPIPRVTFHRGKVTKARRGPSP